jgi:hypothetical protein
MSSRCGSGKSDDADDSANQSGFWLTTIAGVEFTVAPAVVLPFPSWPAALLFPVAPSCPELFEPQQYTPCVLDTPQAWVNLRRSTGRVCPPSDTLWTVGPPTILLGVTLECCRTRSS